MTKNTPWPRDEWLEAIWDCETLNPSQRAVTYAYYRFAGKSDVSWCSWPELMRRTGIRSRDTVNRVLKQLAEAGWLEEVERARQHHSARYRLAIPVIAQASDIRTADAQSQESDSRTAEAPSSTILSSQQSDSSAPGDRFSDPTPQKDSSENLLTGGHAAPRTPLRGETPPAPRTEHESEPPERGTDQLNSQGDPPNARAGVRTRASTCDGCGIYLEPDGSCLKCRRPARRRAS